MKNAIANTEACLANIERHNEITNAFITVLPVIRGIWIGFRVDQVAVWRQPWRAICASAQLGPIRVVL